MEIRGAERFFDGVLFRSSGEPSRESGRITVTAHALRFQSAHSTIELPLEALTLELGGANQRLLFFRAASSPAISISTTDRTIIKVLARHPIASLNPALPKVRRHQRRFLWGAGALGAGIVLFLAALLALKDPLAGFIARRIPISWEETAGQAIEAALPVRTIEDAAVDAALADFLSPLAQAIRPSGYSPRISVTADNDLNAFAIPGGIVMINSGVIERAESGAEVLGVAAHELAHVTERHVTKNIVTSVGLYAAFSLLIGDAVGGIAAIANTAPLLLSKSYSRDLERDADAVGFQYLLEADIDPRGMVRFFERVMAEEETRTKGAAQIPGALQGLQFFSTHPATQERIEALKARIAALPPKKYRDVEGSFQKLKRLVAR